MKQKCYYKSELAALYMPHSSIETARRSLNRAIHSNEKMLFELNTTGYKKTSKCLFPIQVQIIIRHLGIPDGFYLEA